MIIINIKMKCNDYNQEIDDFYVNHIGMKKRDQLSYYSDDDVFGKTCDAFRLLMSRKWFSENVLEFIQDTDSEVVDLIEQYHFEQNMKF